MPLYWAFGRVFIKTGRLPLEFHRYLLEAKEDLLGADYQDAYPVSQEDAEEHLERAKAFWQVATEKIGMPP